MTGKDTCPIDELDDFTLEHWDIPTLCDYFNCKTCVVDFYELYGPDGADEADAPVESLEIPF